MELEASGIAFAYGARRILEGASVSVRAGRLLAILGPNGAGKSTLLRILSGLLAPDAGEVKLDGAPLSSLTRKQIAQRIAHVPQDPPPDAGYTALELVLMGRAPHLGGWGVEGQADRDKALAALRELEVEALANRPLSLLSGGEKRRVLLARARCQEAQVVLLDEPTAHLDLGHQAHALARARAWADAGAAVAAVLHDPNLARTCATEVALVHAGGRVETGGLDLLEPARLSTLYGWPIEEAPLFRAARR